MGVGPEGFGEEGGLGGIAEVVDLAFGLVEYCRGMSGPHKRFGANVVVEVVLLKTNEEVSSIYGKPAELCAIRSGRSTFRCTWPSFCVAVGPRAREA